jgi:hypothetical protein
MARRRVRGHVGAAGDVRVGPGGVRLAELTVGRGGQQREHVLAVGRAHRRAGQRGAVQLVVEAQPCARQQGADSLGPEPQHGGDLGVAQSLEPAEGQRGALLGAQPPGGGRQARRRRAPRVARRPFAREQVVRRGARGLEDGGAEAVARAREARELGVGEQEGVLGRVGRGVGAPQDPLAEGEDARPTARRAQRDPPSPPPAPAPARRSARARRGILCTAAGGTARRTVVRRPRAFPVDRPAPATCGS